jgi:hypothetical protein
MIFLIVVATIFAGYGTAYLASEDVRYVTRAGIEETRILQAREPIAELVADRATDPAVRHSLRLVLQSGRGIFRCPKTTCVPENGLSPLVLLDRRCCQYSRPTRPPLGRFQGQKLLRPVIDFQG